MKEGKIRRHPRGRPGTGHTKGTSPCVSSLGEALRSRKKERVKEGQIHDDIEKKAGFCRRAWSSRKGTSGPETIPPKKKKAEESKLEDFPIPDRGEEKKAIVAERRELFSGREEKAPTKRRPRIAFQRKLFPCQDTGKGAFQEKKRDPKGPEAPWRLPGKKGGLPGAGEGKKGPVQGQEGTLIGGKGGTERKRGRETPAWPLKAARGGEEKNKIHRCSRTTGGEGPARENRRGKGSGGKGMLTRCQKGGGREFPREKKNGVKRTVARKNRTSTVGGEDFS